VTRVLQAMAGAHHGGAEAFFTRLVPALTRAGVEQRVVIRENAERAAILRAAGIDPVQVRFGSRLDLATPLRLRREVGSFQPDIVLTWMSRATDMFPRGSFVHVARLGGYYDLKYYRKCDHLIGNTEDIVRHLVDGGWPADRAHYLPNFVAGEQAAPAAREPHYTPRGAPLILAMGRLHPNKGFDVLLEAMTRLLDVYLWIAGEGPEREALERQAEALAVKPRVRFLGWRDDTAALLAAADIFVCPSRHEPLGNVVIEAWAQAVPVIAAESQGPGALIADMENGILVPPEDAETIARAVRYLFANADVAASVARAGRTSYEERFTESKVVAHYLEFFDRVKADD